MEFAHQNFRHDVYDLDESGVLSRKAGIPVPSSAEEVNAESRSVLEAVTSYIQVRPALILPERVLATTGKDVVIRTRRALDPR